MPRADATRLLRYEAQALLQRLVELRPFALTLPMVPAAAPSAGAQAAIEAYMTRGRAQLRGLVERFLRWLESPAGVAATPARAQERFTAVRLRFLTVITQFDIFADALAERSQHGYGELIGGLDVAASDALELPGRHYEVPPVICHLDRGAGAAIRRARTRLPGGGATPVAIIRVPRERMIGSAIAGSLVHEVGHQGAELLNLVEPLRARLSELAGAGGPGAPAWHCLRRWISEIIADTWSVARVGIAAPVGLIGVVSLPRAFVTRISLDGPHPTPWIRVKISAAIGRALYPDPQWDRLSSLWEQLYPLDEARNNDARLFRLLEATLPAFARLVLGFRPENAGGATLAEIFAVHDRAPARLRQLWAAHRSDHTSLAGLPPTVAFAVVGQARYDGAISAQQEVSLLRRLLRYWALRSTVDASELCASARRPRAVALAV